jgi:hypothetical protein
MSSSTLINNNNLITQYLLDKFKLWIWDFDDTLIDTTTYYKLSMETKDIMQRTNNQLTIDFPNWEFFRDLVIFLISRGVRVGIASFGTYRIIKAYMDRIFGLNQKIFTKHNLKALCRDPTTGKPTRFYPNKNDFMDSIMEHFRIYEPIKVILFDDNITNISGALAVGVVSVKIKGKTHNNINQYTENTDDSYFSSKIINQLEETLKRLEKGDAKKKGCSPNNLKNERFSSIGSRKIGTINKANRINRETFLRSIKNKYQKDNFKSSLIENDKLTVYLESHKPEQSIQKNQKYLETKRDNNIHNNSNNSYNNEEKKITNKYKKIILILILIIIGFIIYNL